MKKAFTLPEVLITVTIIGVLMAIIASVVGSPAPNRDKIQYKKAMSTLQTAIGSATNDIYEKASNPENGWKDPNFTKSDFCNAVASYLNTVGDVDCDIEESSFDEPNFKTSDGIRYWGLEGGFQRTEIVDEKEVTTRQNKETIMIDYSMKNVDRNLRQEKSGYDYKYGLKIDVYYDGKVTVDNDYTYEMSLLDD